MKTCIECKKPVFNKEVTCGPCRHRKWKKSNPEKYAFQALRWSAIRRGIVFNLTLEEFTGFIAGTGYLEKKHKTKKDALTIDRINEGGAYEIGNIQILTRLENSRKFQISKARVPVTMAPVDLYEESRLCDSDLFMPEFKY